ncbi:MAG TPA: PLP-dependent aminotransferase family protein [Actinomycetota bacterium]
MTDLFVDPYIDLYADRMAGMSASEVRALFAVASRPDVVSLAGGMPFVSALPTGDVLDAVESVLRQHGSAALQYCGGIGLPGIREAVVRLMAEEDVEASADRVLITNGAQQALDLVGKVFLDAGDEVMVEEPCYVGALSAFSAYEPRFVQIPMDDEGMVVEELEAALARGVRPKFVYTVPNFSNPSGVTMSLARRDRLVEVCRAAGVPIVEDNPYGMLRFEGDAVPCLRSLDPANVIYLGTLSKVFAPGVRVGWALAEPGTLDRLVLAKEAADLCSSAFTQLLAERYLDGDRWRVNLAALVDVYHARRDAMLESLERDFPASAHWTHPAGGFYVWATLEGVDTPSLLPLAVDHRVAYVPGTAFYPDGRGRDRMRLSFCYPPEDAVREGIRRLGALLAERSTLRPAVGD